MSDAIRIPGAPTPEFRAILRAVPGDAIAARDQKFNAAFILKRDDRAVSFPRLLMRIRRPDMLPEFLARVRFAKYPPAVKPLWPPPMTMVSYWFAMTEFPQDAPLNGPVESGKTLP